MLRQPTLLLVSSQVPLRGSGHFQPSNVTFRSEEVATAIAMAEAAAAKQGEYVCQCIVGIRV